MQEGLERNLIKSPLCMFSDCYLLACFFDKPLCFLEVNSIWEQIEIFISVCVQLVNDIIH